MSLPIQADAIRVAILEKYGGIWMDIDIIISNYSFLKNAFEYDLAMFGNTQEKKPAIGFIYASKNSRIIKEWLINIIKRVSIYKELKAQKNFEKLKNIYIWNYLGNGILNSLLKTAKEKEFIIFDWIKMNALPEKNIYKNLGNEEAYHKLYFFPGDPQKVLCNNQGIIFLHNSWTENKYKYMTKIAFLKQNIMLSNILKKILKKYILKTNEIPPKIESHSLAKPN